MSSSQPSCWVVRPSVQTPKKDDDWLNPDECFESEGLENFGEEQTDLATGDFQEILESLTAALEELNTRFRAVASLEMVRSEIALIHNRLSRLEEGASILVPIQSLAPEPYELVKPIEAVVQFADDEYMASFFDANLSTGGDTQVEAISNLKDLIVGTFELLIEIKDSELGPAPSRQKAILREFIRVR